MIRYGINPKATTKITDLSTKPTNQIRHHHEKCSMNFKEIRKEGYQEQVRQIASKYDVVDETK